MTVATVFHTSIDAPSCELKRRLTDQVCTPPRQGAEGAVQRRDDEHVEIADEEMFFRLPPAASKVATVDAIQLQLLRRCINFTPPCRRALRFDRWHGNAMRDSEEPSRTDDLRRAVEAYHAVLHGTATRILGCGDAAHDAVQETLIALWLDPPAHGAERAWLLRTVIYRSLHQRRSRQRRHYWEREAADSSPDDCWICNAQRVLEQQETRSMLERALAELPESFRTAFVLRELDGRAYECIAERLGVPLGTVRSRLNRARSALRTHLAGALAEPAAAPARGCAELE